MWDELKHFLDWLNCLNGNFIQPKKSLLNNKSNPIQSTNYIILGGLGWCTPNLGGKHEWTEIIFKWDRSWKYESVVKKILNELKVTTYANRVHLLFWWLNRRNSKVKHASLGAIMLGDLLENFLKNMSFLRKYVSEDKVCWKDDPCWFVWIVFTLRKWFKTTKDVRAIRMLDLGCYSWLKHTSLN